MCYSGGFRVPAGHDRRGSSRRPFLCVHSPSHPPCSCIYISKLRFKNTICWGSQPLHRGCAHHRLLGRALGTRVALPRMSQPEHTGIASSQRINVFSHENGPCRSKQGTLQGEILNGCSATWHLLHCSTASSDSLFCVPSFSFNSTLHYITAGMLKGLTLSIKGSLITPAITPALTHSMNAL